MMNNPLSEVFGYPIDNQGDDAVRQRSNQLCRFNNKVPNCTKDKATDPLGVCSINFNETSVITCPVRFRENWIIADDAASFLFSKDTKWTSLSEVSLKDANGNAAGSLDYVLVSYDEFGKVIDFGSLEVQAVYVSGNIRNPFSEYVKSPSSEFLWPSSEKYPRPDFLSSSRKRLLPQILFKGGIFKEWKKKQVIALQERFFDTLPYLPVVEKDEADIAWNIYDLVLDTRSSIKRLTKIRTEYTKFDAAVQAIMEPKAGDVNDFIHDIQAKLDKKLDQGVSEYQNRDLIQTLRDE